MENDGLSIIVAAQDRELDSLREVVAIQRQMLDALGEAVEKLADATARMHQHVERQHVLVQRHDRTLRAMHKGLHETSDPTS